jgi:uncharacterized membrane protein HdeD (DUF308 family)
MAVPNRTWRRVQAARHIVMGIILIALGVAVVRFHKFGTMELSVVTSYTLAAIMVLYGLFRIWRGTRDLKEKDPEDYVT